MFQAMHKLQQLQAGSAQAAARMRCLSCQPAGAHGRASRCWLTRFSTNREMGRYTNHCNLLDWCAVAVPAGDAAPHTPFGITLFAIAEEEGLDLRRGRAVLAGAGAASEVASASEGASVSVDSGASAAAAQATTLVAVCGLHMRGYPLEKQMLGCGARFIREDEPQRSTAS